MSRGALLLNTVFSVLVDRCALISCVLYSFSISSRSFLIFFFYSVVTSDHSIALEPPSDCESTLTAAMFASEKHPQGIRDLFFFTDYLCPFFWFSLCAQPVVSIFRSRDAFACGSCALMAIRSRRAADSLRLPLCGSRDAERRAAGVLADEANACVKSLAISSSVYTSTCSSSTSTFSTTPSAGQTITCESNNNSRPIPVYVTPRDELLPRPTPSVSS